MPERTDFPAGTVVHGYSVVRPLGGGQMGDVYEAAARDGRRVAVKILRAQAAFDGETRERFLREARVCAELKSPHVVPVLDHGIHEGRPVLVMPLLHGSDLESWLDRASPLRPDVAVAIALQACDALAIAHARGIVHRDLKPANLFISQGRATYSTIVCDFGVAKTVDEDGALTASGAVVGTPLYMAPEQMLDSKRVDGRCDVWALGMTLYHMLSGQTAHGDVRTIADLVLQLSTNTLVPLQSVAPWISPSLARVVHAALLPLEKRFQTVEQLASALARWGPRPVEISERTLVAAPADMRASAAPLATLPQSHEELGTPDEATMADAASTPMSEAAPSDARIGKSLGGKYRLVRRLGSGGMGAVYECVDEQGRHAAVKIMHADGGRDDDAARRFTREMRAVRAIDSPHVVKPVDFGVDEADRMPFFVMELLSGRDLGSVLATVGSIAPPVAAELFVQACRALEAAHALGIVHRDIKPSNLFVHEPGDGTVVLKVCDFGIAKRVETTDLDGSTELTRTGGLLGSPIYMSPEHAKNAKNVDARSDVWSLGMSLHEALSGLRPWQGCTSVGEVIVAICMEEVPKLRDVAPWVDPALVAVVERCLEKDASRRWPSIGALRAALEPFRATAPLRVDALRPADVAGSSPSARASSVRPPGLVTSGSLAAAARPAMDASVSLPMERRGSWRWIAAAAAVGALVVGGGAAYRAMSGAAPKGSATASVAATESSPSAASTVPSAVELPSARPIAAASASVAVVASSASRLAPAPVASQRARLAPAGRAPSVEAVAPAVGPATPALAPQPATPLQPATPAGTPARSDGRASSRKDDG